MKRMIKATAVAATLMAPVLAATGTGAQTAHDEPVYQITVENITSGQYLTPPNVALHDRAASVFERNRPASPGVQAVAENGGVPVLAAELAGALDATGLGSSGVIGGAPIFPGDSATGTLVGDFDRLSLVSMVICTNDSFAGIDSIPLKLKVGQSASLPVQAFDAGTEIDTENDADIVPAPFCADPSVGTGMSNPDLAEGGVVRPDNGFRGVGDLRPEVYDWNGPVARITIERIG